MQTDLLGREVEAYRGGVVTLHGIIRVVWRCCNSNTIYVMLETEDGRLSGGWDINNIVLTKENK